MKTIRSCPRELGLNPEEVGSSRMERKNRMLRQEYSWFLDHPEIIAQYSGEYIAIVGEKVVAHGRDFKAVFEEAEKHGKPLVHKVQPTDKEIIL